MTRRLRVAVDARDLAGERRGIGRYARALLSRAAERDDVEITLLVRGWMRERHRSALADAIGNDRFALRGSVPADADVAWHPWNGTFFASAIPAVVTMHDVVPFAFPDSDAVRRAHQQAPFLRSAATAARIVTDSTFSRDEIVRHLDIERERIDVIPLGVDELFALAPQVAVPPVLAGRSYVFVAGAGDAHKNVAAFERAFARAFPRGDVVLVRTLAESTSSGAIVLGTLDDATLRAVYAAALFVAVPSQYEGFGLPALEAAAGGTPVLASRAASLPEVLGDAAAYVDEYRDESAWAWALRSLADDAPARERLRALGIERARAFTWSACFERTLAVLASVARRR